MKTLEELKTEIQKHLLRVEELEQNPLLPTKNALEEKSIGRLCYQAEEALSPTDLKKLKKALGVDENHWRSYKSRFIHYPPEEG